MFPARWNLPSADSSAVNLDHFLRADDGEWHEAAELGVLLHSVLIVFFDVVREVIATVELVLPLLSPLIGFEGLWTYTGIL